MGIKSPNKYIPNTNITEINYFNLGIFWRLFSIYIYEWIYYPVICNVFSSKASENTSRCYLCWPSFVSEGKYTSLTYYLLQPGNTHTAKNITYKTQLIIPSLIRCSKCISTVFLYSVFNWYGLELDNFIKTV